MRIFCYKLFIRTRFHLTELLESRLETLTVNSNIHTAFVFILKPDFAYYRKFYNS